MRKLFALALAAVMLLALLPAGGVSAAEPTGVFQQMHDRAEEIVIFAWTPSVRIDVWNENPYNGKMYFEAGEVVHGMPYTLFARELGFKSMITLREYKAVADKNYSVTHFCNAMWEMRTGPVYGSCCATFICEILGEGFLNEGLPIYSSVGPLARDGHLTSRRVKADEILPGDLLYDKDWSHIVWVGSVTEKTITVYEQTPPISKTTTIPLSNVTEDGYLILRNHVYAFASRSNSFAHAGPHVPVYDAPKEPTCTEDGLTAGSHCVICGENIELQMSIPAYGHTREYVVEESAATDETDGWTVWRCAVCGEDEKVWIPCESCAAKRFEDTPLGVWHHEYIDFVRGRGYMNGVSETIFAPDETMSRAMLVTVLWRYAGEPSGGNSGFTDVPDGQWYTDAVAWAAANSIVNGVGGGRFDPNGAVTRAQFATILHRYAKREGLPSDTAAALDFPDRAAVPGWALDAMRWAVAEGLLSGSGHADGKDYLDPQHAATRAQVAKMLTQFVKNVAEEAA
ncbi:MAG: S-layer homology domain-containing protein [Oscillospiraceae bacterium]|nr:S-layer homology domain-containing protein [Oscillospiraceae bacterium]